MKINLTGYINPKTSYGLVTLAFLRGLTDLGNEVSIFENIGDGNQFGDFAPYVRDSSLLSQNFDHDTLSLRIAHQFDMAPSIGHGARVGYTFFEVNKLTPLEVHHLKSLDTLIVPTKWAADVCINSGLQLPEVCPAGYDHTVFTPIEYMPQSCVFLSVGKWEVRKQQDMIVHAFNRAFGPDDNVSLWMSCDNQFIQPYVDEKKKYYKELIGDKLKLIGRVNSHHDLARIMQQAYCFVAPSLAEGWNLPLLEAMGCGKFTIATNYSGHTEFCNKDTTLLIDPMGLQPAIDGMWFKEESKTNCGEWCTYDVDQLIECMRATYDKYRFGKILNEYGLMWVRDFSWEESSRKMERVLQECICGTITQRNQNMGLYEPRFY